MNFLYAKYILVSSLTALSFLKKTFINYPLILQATLVGLPCPMHSVGSLITYSLFEIKQGQTITIMPCMNLLFLAWLWLLSLFPMFIQVDEVEAVHPSTSSSGNKWKSSP
jgi:hypothetical protein